MNTIRKSTKNEIPQEIKFTLVFDEQTDGPDLIKLQNRCAQSIKEEIESDEEDELMKEEIDDNQLRPTNE